MGKGKDKGRLQDMIDKVMTKVLPSETRGYKEVLVKD